MKKEKENLEVEACEMADKKHMILKMLFGVLAFIVVVISCFGAGYFGAQLGNKENNNEETKNEEQNKEDKVEVEKLTIDSQIVKELFEIFREDRNCMMSGLWDLYSELDAKKYIAYSQLEESDFENKVCNQLDKQKFDYYTCNIDGDFSQTTKTFSAARLKEKYEKIFGKSGYVDGNFNISEGPIAYYDALNKLYAEFSCFCGGDCGIGYDHILDSVEQKGTTLVLNTTIVHDEKYYEDIEEDFDLENISIVFTFELEKETGNYIFVSRVEK